MNAGEQRVADEPERPLEQNTTPDSASAKALDPRFAAPLQARLRRARTSSHAMRDLSSTPSGAPRWPPVKVERARLLAAAATLLLALVSFVIFRIVGTLPFANAPTPSTPPGSTLTMVASPNRRSLAIDNIRNCLGVPDATVQYLSTARSSYASEIMADFYHTGSYDAQVNSATAQLIQIGPSAGSPIPDQGSRLTSDQLQALALKFIARCAGPSLAGLVENGGTKGDNTFFRWEDRTRTLEGMYPFVQVGLNPLGQLLSYTNTLDLAPRATLTSTPVANMTPAPFAVDSLAYVQADGLWVKDLPGGTPRRVASGTISQPHWSALGPWLIYLDGQQRWVVRRPGRDARMVPYTAS